MNLPYLIKCLAILGFKRYNPASVAITGGTINGAVIGGVTPAAGTFTTIEGTDATDSSSSTTGALKVAGGVGIAKKLFVGTSFQVGSGSTTSAGLIAGYSGTSGGGSIWSTAVSPSTINHALQVAQTVTGVNATGVIYLTINGSSRFNVTNTTVTHLGDMIYDKTITAPATTGAQTINKTTGRVNFAAAAASLVVTNSLVTANSIIQATVATNDATMKSVACVATAGSFTMYANANPTAETAVNFTVTN